uniref:triacylglycerol lipase n=1 Tax=Periophthalmus magnuspinnatus TaxID=409849 RepID=A0A3B4B227_9GOBI
MQESGQTDSLDRDPGQTDSLDRGWSISFAGCGFMGVYYIGVAACLFQRCPELVHRAARLYGSSAGALLAAILTVEEACSELMSLARGARAHRLGPLHPDFNLMQHVHNFLVRTLPVDAYVHASGRLFISVTRVPDRKNQLLSEFNSNEELIQALICSCFVPFYCGIFPPKYRGVRYVDGAVSDNLPRCDQKKTITISPYAGESDICPQLQYTSQVLFNNMSIEVNPENLYRVTSTFFPPEPQVLAEICQNGFVDALRFLQENGEMFLLSWFCCKVPHYGTQNVLVEWLPDAPTDLSWLYSVFSPIWKEEEEEEELTSRYLPLPQTPPPFRMIE